MFKLIGKNKRNMTNKKNKKHKKHPTSKSPNLKITITIKTLPNQNIKKNPYIKNNKKKTFVLPESNNCT